MDVIRGEATAFFSGGFISASAAGWTVRAWTDGQTQDQASVIAALKECNSRRAPGAVRADIALALDALEFETTRADLEMLLNVGS